MTPASPFPIALVQATPSLDDPFYGLYELGWGVEPFVFIVSAVLAIRGLWRHFPLAAHRLFVHAPNPGLGVTRVAIAFAGAWFFIVLATGAASDIVGYYTWMYVAFAFASLLAASFAFPILGLYHPGDVVERANLAAGLVLGGFALGTAFAFGGALTGEGPGWWVVLAFFLLAYAELRGNLALVARLAGGLADDVRIERDASAGLLLGAVAAASGLVSGRAAAGDFLGWEHGLGDYFRRLWPLLLIALVGALAGGLSRIKGPKLVVRAAASVALVAFGAWVYFFT